MKVEHPGIWWDGSDTRAPNLQTFSPLGTYGFVGIMGGHTSRPIGQAAAHGVALI